VIRFRRAGLHEPSTTQLLEQLRDAYSRGECHLHADHQIPIEQRPDLRLDLENMRTRCNICHDRKTATENGGFGRALNSIIQPKVPPVLCQNGVIPGVAGVCNFGD